MRPPLSVTGTRWTRWTPLSNLSRANTPWPVTEAIDFLEAADFRRRSPRSARTASPWSRHSAGTCAAGRRRTARPRRRRCRRGFRASPARSSAASRGSSLSASARSASGSLRRITSASSAAIARNSGSVPRSSIMPVEHLELGAQPPHLARRLGDRLDLGIILGQLHEGLGREIGRRHRVRSSSLRASMAAIRSAEIRVMILAWSAHGPAAIFSRLTAPPVASKQACRSVVGQRDKLAMQVPVAPLSSDRHSPGRARRRQ